MRLQADADVQCTQRMCKHLRNANLNGIREELERLGQQERPNLPLMAAAEVRMGFSLRRTHICSHCLTVVLKLLKTGLGYPGWLNMLWQNILHLQHSCLGDLSMPLNQLTTYLS
jgi:hypothetical protein